MEEKKEIPEREKYYAVRANYTSMYTYQYAILKKEWDK
jgi:hypothetical protein